MNNNSLKSCPFCGGNGTRKLIKPYRKVKVNLDSNRSKANKRIEKLFTYNI